MKTFGFWLVRWVLVAALTALFLTNALGLGLDAARSESLRIIGLCLLAYLAARYAEWLYLNHRARQTIRKLMGWQYPWWPSRELRQTLTEAINRDLESLGARCPYDIYDFTDLFERTGHDDYCEFADAAKQLGHAVFDDYTVYAKRAAERWNREHPLSVETPSGPQLIPLRTPQIGAMQTA